MIQRATIQSLWLGDKLTTMEIMCLRSFIAHGHDFVLYTYGPVVGVPEGVTVVDGNSVLSSDEYKPSDFLCASNFSDFFRMKLMRDVGGWWVDMDALCLRPFDFEAPYVFGSEAKSGGGSIPACSFMKIPRGSAIAEWMWNNCLTMDIKTLGWTQAGMDNLREAISVCGLEKYVVPTEVFCPVPWWEAKSFVDPSVSLVFGPQVAAVHLWNKMWSLENLNKERRDPRTFYGARAREYTDDKTLIAIVTCAQNASKVQEQFDEWMIDAVEAGLRVQMFDGARLGVPDDYAGLPQKTQALCRWALDNGYDRLLKIDDDAFVNVEVFEDVYADYAGIRIQANDMGSHRLGIPNAARKTYPLDYASGGAYWLSARSMQIVADEPLGADWAEDRWVGHTLAKHGIGFTELPDYGLVWLNPLTHFVGGNYTVVTQIPYGQMHKVKKGSE